MEFSTKEMNSFHKKLKQKISERLKYTVIIISNYQNNELPKLRENTNIQFYAQSGFQETEERFRGPNCEIFPIYEKEAKELLNVPWASWHEEWSVIRKGQFWLHSLSWTYFWGVTQHKKVQIFRSEWAGISKSSNQEAQPHWHFDYDVISDESDRISGTATKEDAPLSESRAHEVGRFEELSKVEKPRRKLTLEKLHLGMGGWLNSKEYPLCWQCNPKSKEEIVVWADKNLELAINEFRRLMN